MQSHADVAFGQPMAPEPCAVRGRKAEIPGVVTLDIDPPGGVPFRFRPGQFNMLYVFGIGEVPISMSGEPAKPETITHTIREAGAVTRAMIALDAGDMIGVRGPFGTAWPLAEAAGRDIVIITGGIGLAPLRPAIYAILEKRDAYRRVTLLYGARTPADLLYTEELGSWRSRFDLHVEITVDGAGADWRGNVGVVPAMIPRAPFDPTDAVAYVCGPEVMMRFTIAALQDRGVPDDRIFISLERNMRCAIGFCGHCQLGPTFVCKDGPVFPHARIGPWIGRREV